MVCYVWTKEKTEYVFRTNQKDKTTILDSKTTLKCRFIAEMYKISPDETRISSCVLQTTPLKHLKMIRVLLRYRLDVVKNFNETQRLTGQKKSTPSHRDTEAGRQEATSQHSDISIYVECQAFFSRDWKCDTGSHLHLNFP